MSTARETSLFSRVRRRFVVGVGRLRANGWPVIQTSVGASLAYFLAAVVLGQEQPFFAPIAAVISLGLTIGERGRRTVEVVLGVAIGLLVADLLVLFIGIGTVQVGLVVALAMAAAVFFADRSLFVNQAAISAILVIVLQPPASGFSPDRFVSALIGGAVALAINHLFPVNSERRVERSARPIFDELASVLEEVSASLRGSDPERAERMLTRAREIDGMVRAFNESLTAGYETARLSPTRRRSLRHLELYSNASLRVELAVINTRVLARGAANAVRRGDSVPSSLPEAVLDLSRAVRALAVFLERPGPPDDARRCALEAARRATKILEERHDLATSVLVGQIRSAAVDLLRSTGMDQASALQALEEAAGRASEIG
ncbi:aromatic acid exporter family protein [soil metagenome]